MSQRKGKDLGQNEQG